MTFTEFMKLEVGDGVIVDGRDATITNLINHSKGELKKENDMKICFRHSTRDLEISYFNDRNRKVEKLYVVIYTDYPNEVHNRSVLERLSVWNPFQI